jgi:hypothetical protein
MHDAVARGVGNYHNQHTHGRCPLLCNTAPLGRDAIFLTRIREANTDSRPTEIPRPTNARALPYAMQYRPVGARIYFLRGDTKPTRIADQRRFHDQQTQGRCPVLYNTAPLGLGYISYAEIRRYRDTEIQRYRDTEIRRHEDTKTRRHGDTDTRSQHG